MKTGALTFLDWTVVVAYFGFIIWLGVGVGKRQKTSEQYFLGSRTLPGWAISVSMFATIISSWSFMALPGKGFQSDLKYLMAASMVPLAAWITARWIVGFFREQVKLSAYEYLERRFGLGARLYGNLAFLIVHFGKMAAILYLLCLALAGMTSWNLFTLIAVVGAAAVVYSYFGGIEGAVWTEVIEGGLLLLAGFIAIGFLLFGAPGGPAAVMDTALAAEKFDLLSWEFAWDKTNTVVLVCFSLNYYLQKYVTDQTIVQRMLLSPTSAKASRALWQSSGLLVLVWILFMVVGVLLWAYYQLQPELLPAGVRAKPDAVFPHFIGHQLPAGITGLVLAGLVAGTVSTLSSDLNSLGAVMLDDYYRKLAPQSSGVRQFWFSRAVVLVAGLLCVALAMAMTRIHSMADAAFDFVSLVGGGVLGMYLLGFLVKRCGARALYAGIACGVTFVLWATLCGPGEAALPSLPRFPLHTLWVGLLGNLVVFTVGYLASFVLKNQSAAAPVLARSQ